VELGTGDARVSKKHGGVIECGLRKALVSLCFCDSRQITVLLHGVTRDGLGGSRVSRGLRVSESQIINNSFWIIPYID
jgi:hypothetical protein